ncbi:hypothetical protein [Haloferula sargassicola]|uniref:Type IV pilus biogenesis protein PilP n=1 Tax=Haloferula sargassicola TaxID=490096 RepID=A0ABP9UT54_9BACT
MKTIFVISAALSLTGLSQTLAPVPAPPSGADSATSSAPEAKDNAPELINTPSRNVGLDVEAYLRSVESSLDMRNRQLDPFGRYQDPNRKAVVQQPLARHTITKARTIPFSDHVNQLPISGVVSGKEFLIGARTYRIGDQLTLKIERGELRVQVIAIGSDSVTFQDLASEESATKHLGILPPGMERGNKQSLPPGFVPLDQNPTIDLTPGTEDPLSQR